MNIKKSKIALALSGLLFLSVPLSSAFADQKHCEMDGNMASIKSELSDYVKSIKANDAQKTQQHINTLLQLSEKATNEMANMDHSKMDMKEMAGMDHSKMDMKDMAGMDHSKMDMKDMAGMDHSKMDMKDMSGMDHSKMDMKDMAGMDHSKMDMKEMAGMDHSKMDMKDMANMDHSKMQGMSDEEHQHMMHMQGVSGLNDLFKQLANTQDKTEIKEILGKVKEHSKQHKMFTKKCH
jgi:hypothetical protein